LTPVINIKFIAIMRGFLSRKRPVYNKTTPLHIALKTYFCSAYPQSSSKNALNIKPVRSSQRFFPKNLKIEQFKQA
jgi:hypothetical protein